MGFRKDYIELAAYINRVKGVDISPYLVTKYFTQHSLKIEDVVTNTDYLKFVICDISEQPHEFVFGLIDVFNELKASHNKLQEDYTKLRQEFDEFRERMEGSHNVKKIKALEKTLNAVKRSNCSERITLKKQLRQATEQVQLGNKSPEVYKRVEELSEAIKIIDEYANTIDEVLAMEEEISWT